MAKQLTWEQAISRVLEEADTPLHYIEITDRIVASELRTSLGATPAATVASVLSTTIKRDGDRAPWVRLGKGTYGPAGRVPLDVQSTVAPSSITDPEERDQEEQYAVVSSFGMYWSRDAVEWVRSPRILGKQYGGSAQVDFCNQIGVYLLYDGREVIYVGRATERGLGVRLYEHTWDRLASRWDRFSWFGFSPVGEDGTLRSMPATFDASKLGPALEAILVEAVEPRQNRKRGDDLAQVEYLQVEDPAVRRRALKAALDEAIQ
jgi:hypothetical protein